MRKFLMAAMLALCVTAADAGPVVTIWFSCPTVKAANAFVDLSPGPEAWGRDKLPLGCEWVHYTDVEVTIVGEHRSDSTGKWWSIGSFYDPEGALRYSAGAAGGMA